MSLVQDPPLFNPEPTLSVMPLGDGAPCLILDNVLLDPDRVAEWAATHAQFQAPDYPYPGRVAAVPSALAQALTTYFDRVVRDRLGARRQSEALIRLSLLNQPASTLHPMQWLCHRDRIASDPARVLFAASVLYLFRDPQLAGTDFYRPKRSAADTDQLVADSQRLDPSAFSARYGIQPGYMSPERAEPYFEHIAHAPAAWNRMICYDGGRFHSARVTASSPDSTDPRDGRLTLNGFYTCTRRLTA